MSEQTRNKIKEALRALGNSHAAIAESLKAKGIRAVSGPLRATTCPIAVFLKGELNGLEVSVGIGTACYEENGRAQHLRLSNPVYNFIYQFDHKHYPELEAP